MLLGCYRKGDANDPDTYTAAIAAVLSDYPEETIRFVTDPRTGISTKFTKWMPNSGEVKQACEEHYGPTRRAIEREARARRQLEERETMAILDLRPRKPYDQIVQECRAMGLMIGPKERKKHETDVNAFLQEHGVSREQFDALPNAPDYRWK